MSGGTKVFVGNLPDKCEDVSLRDLFSPYGKISNMTVIKNYAFIHFDKNEDAHKAVTDLHKTKLLGKELTVEISKSKQRGGGAKRSERRPFIGDKRSRNTGLSSMSNVGGILGMSPAAIQPALGLLSAINSAVSGQRPSDFASEQRPSHSSHDLSNHQHVNTFQTLGKSRDVPSQDRNLSDGFVIYERFYVDPSHPLLKGLPVPEIPRITDSLAAQDLYQKKDPHSSSFRNVPIRDDPYSTRRADPFVSRRDDPFSDRRDDSYYTGRNEYDTRERSPIISRRDYERGNGDNR